MPTSRPVEAELFGYFAQHGGFGMLAALEESRDEPVPVRRTAEAVHEDDAARALDDRPRRRARDCPTARSHIAGTRAASGRRARRARAPRGSAGNNDSPRPPSLKYSQARDVLAVAEMLDLDSYFERIGYSGPRSRDARDAARAAAAPPASDSIRESRHARGPARAGSISTRSSASSCRAAAAATASSRICCSSTCCARSGSTSLHWRRASFGSAPPARCARGRTWCCSSRSAVSRYVCDVGFGGSRRRRRSSSRPTSSNRRRTRRFASCALPSEFAVEAQRARRSGNASIGSICRSSSRSTSSS